MSDRWKTTTVSSLRVGQRFKWIPNAWYGPAKLLTKKKIPDVFWTLVRGKSVMRKQFKYDLRFDAAVVNSPGMEYGIPGDRKVRVLVRSR